MISINSISITNYKSIEQLTIGLHSFGEGANTSKTAILVGINESGKSNILEAINAANHGFDEHDFDTHYYKLGKDNSILVRYDLSFEWEHLKLLFKEQLTIPDELLDALVPVSCARECFLGPDKAYDYFHVEFEELDWHRYAYSSKVKGDQQVQVIQEVISADAPEAFKPFEKFAIPYDSNATKLTKELMETLFKTTMLHTLKQRFPRIIYWKSSPTHLINDKIDLQAFAQNNEVSVALRNIFSIYGMKTPEEIAQRIAKALNNDESKSELEEELSEKITNHIKAIWKEHKVKFKIKIDGHFCKVHVEDESTRHKFHKMQHRSDGFKQFISLILSLSVQHDAQQLKDTVILLDEPEVHLHPSGIRYMRDEILRIGKNNFVFVSTHSHYFVDTETTERHFIIEKDTKTTMTQLDSASGFTNDEVVSKAFGFSLLKELLPAHIFLVEGAGDKQLFNLIFSHHLRETPYTIRSAGGCSKILPIAALLNEHDVQTMVLLDDDEEGTKAKTDLVKTFKPSFTKENVLTLRDILPALPKGATLEDLYPKTFVIDFLQQETNETFTLDADHLPVLTQLKSQGTTLKGSQNKEKLDALKERMSLSFIETYSADKNFRETANVFNELGRAIAEKITAK